MSKPRGAAMTASELFPVRSLRPQSTQFLPDGPQLGFHASQVVSVWCRLPPVLTYE